MANQPAVIQSAIKTGVDTVNLTSDDLFDRIINIRFIHKAPAAGGTAKSFTIRSDYEILYLPNGSIQYIVCKQKPSIKLSYKQVSNQTIIGITIDVTNLFIDDESTLEQNNQPIQTAQIQMGYRKQLPDWTTPAFKMRPTDDFIALADNSVTPNDWLLGSGARLVVQVLYAERISNPPDMVTRFHCTVGTFDNGLRWLYTEESAARDASATRTAWQGKSPVNQLPETFFSLISRRFIPSSIPHDIAKEVTVIDNGEGFLSESVGATIYNADGTVQAQLELVDGRMSVDDANKYGVTVTLSDYLWNFPAAQQSAWGFTDDEATVIAPVLSLPVAQMHDLCTAQMNEIVKHYSFIRFYTLSSGNYYAYHTNESSDNTFADPSIYNTQVKKGIFMLPAVYDITWTGTRQIRLPFTSFFNPMQTVAFQARYPLNDVVGAFTAPAPKNNMFLVLLMDVEFSTTGEENMQTLTCVDIEGTYTPVTLVNGQIVPASPAPVVPVPVRNKIWKKQTLTVDTVDLVTVNTMNGSWVSLVNLLINSAQSFLQGYDKTDPTAGWPTGHPTVADVLSDLSNATLLPENVALFSGSAPYALESLILGGNWPILHNGDSITIHWPLLPTYDPTEQIV